LVVGRTTRKLHYFENMYSEVSTIYY